MYDILLMSTSFTGIWPAMFTPVNDNGEPAIRELEKLTQLLIEQNIDGLYILGTTGQGVLFSEQQRKTVTEVVCKTNSGRIPIIAQVGALSTEESIRLAKHAESCRVSGISSVGPIYFPSNASMALEHYYRIAVSTDIPFFPYQLGTNSIPGDTITFIKKLMNIPNVMGMKLTTSELLEISAIHNFAGDDLKLFSGTDELFCHASLCGTIGAIGSTYNVWGAECKYILSAFRNGNYSLSKKYMLGYQKVIQSILPNLWTFYRSAMKLKFGIDIGKAKSPVGNTHTDWRDADVEAILEKVHSLVGSLETRSK